MIVVALGRQEGKTHQLVDWVRDGDPREHYPHYSRVIVVMFDNDRDRMIKTFNLGVHQVITFATFRRKSVMYTETEIAIDNAEYVLEWALGLHGNLKAVSINTGGPRAR